MKKKIKEKSISANIDIQNEQVILVSMMKDKKVRKLCSRRLSGKNFLGKRHKVIFDVLRNMENMEFDEDTFDVLAEGREYGGYQYLKELKSYYDVNENIEVHIEKILKDSAKGKVRNIIPELEELLDDPSSPLEDIQEKLKRIDEDIKRGFVSNKVNDTKTATSAYRQELTKRRKGMKDPVCFGLKGLDEKITEGALPGKVIVITARPSMGKTTFASNLINYWANVLNKDVLACPLETGNTNLMDYVVLQDMNKQGQTTYIPEMIKTFSEMDIAKQHKVNKVLKDIEEKGKIHFSDDTSLTLNDVRMNLENGDYDICVIDLFEKLADVITEGVKANIGTKLDEVQRIAKETNTCIVVVSQLKRYGSVADKRPDLEQIKNSGKYEEVADMVIGLHRPKYYDREVEFDDIEVWLLKQRNGERNFCMSYEFKGGQAMIGDYVEREEEKGW